tara:strand:- start:3001 stop:4050 length:1050 start_codon:yes stop_codon:yes gene_type:complete
VPLFKTEPTTNVADLISKLNTFLTTAGAGNPAWTADVHTPGSGRWAISKDDGAGQSVEVAFQWDTASPNALGIYQYHTGLGAGSYNTGGGTVPYDQDGDSGQGALSTTDATLDNARSVLLTSAPVQYWCFTDDVASAYIVVESSAGTYQHFGFGVLTKFNDWTGGEFCYGQYNFGGTSSSAGLMTSSSHLLDGLTATSTYAASLHMEGFSDTPTNGLWAVCGNDATPGNDRQGTPVARHLVHGGFRAGPHATYFGDFPGDLATGLIPTYPIVAYHADIDASGTSSLNGSFTPMGYMPSVRGISLENFVDEQEVVIGSDTWQMFPSWKNSLGGATLNTSAYQGILYKKHT